MELNEFRRTAVQLGRVMKYVYLLRNYYNNIYNETISYFLKI
jgi:hypothetical protein